MPREAEGPGEWEVLDVRYPLETPWFRVRQDRVRTHRGRRATYTYQEHPGSVLVVPVTADDAIVLLRHYRHPVGRWCREVPAGRIEGDETPLETGRRELSEEAGGRSAEWRRVGSFFVSTGSSTEKATVFLATRVELDARSPGDGEWLDVDVVPTAEAARMAERGGIEDGPSALAVLMCRERLSGGGGASAAEADL